MSKTNENAVPSVIQLINEILEQYPNILHENVSKDDLKQIVFNTMKHLDISLDTLKSEHILPTIFGFNSDSIKLDNLFELIQNMILNSDENLFDHKINKKETNHTEPKTSQEKQSVKEEDTEEFKEEPIEEDIVEPNIIYPNRAFEFVENTQKRAENGMYNPIQLFDDTVITQYSLRIISSLNIKDKNAIQTLLNHISDVSFSKFNIKLTIDSLNPVTFISAIEKSVFYPQKSYMDTSLNKALNEFLIDNSYAVTVSEFIDFIESKKDSYTTTVKDLPLSIQLSELAYLDLDRFDSILFS